ncbi:MAG: hypothetical protein L0287_10125 [Anaerolineae bacterium]|nr:hypothetical protein [Anaerolineae bacterium]
MQIMLFPNGMTACFDEHKQQVSEFQVSWFSIYLEYLDDHDADPTTVTFTMPDGSQAKPFETEQGYGWEWVSRPSTTTSGSSGSSE